MISRWSHFARGLSNKKHKYTNINLFHVAETSGSNKSFFTYKKFTSVKHFIKLVTSTMMMVKTMTAAAPKPKIYSTCKKQRQP